MSQKLCKNKKCQRPLPEGYKYKYCEHCRSERAQQIKKSWKSGAWRRRNGGRHCCYRSFQRENQSEQEVNCHRMTAPSQKKVITMRKEKLCG